MSIGRTCCVGKCYADDNFEKSEVTAEAINRLTPDEKKWLMLFLVLSMNKSSFEKISGETDLKAVVEKIYNMKLKEG